MSYTKEGLEKTYEKEGVVWTTKNPPKELVELVESEKIKPCNCLDIGCGEGFYSIYLAKKGFEVTAIDLSKNAIKFAKQNAEKEGVKINFISMDMFDLEDLDEKFDFVFEWGILHGVAFENRKKYLGLIEKILNSKGKYFSCSFNIENPKFTGPGIRIRKIPGGSKAIVGTKLYFSSLDELKFLFSEYFQIIQCNMFERIVGKGEKPDKFNYLLMEKK
jgi:2-polyprenyl-3-methyl-5-hydroxy-6-metoxy-1,4-benzoquinol methylase